MIAGPAWLALFALLAAPPRPSEVRVPCAGVELAKALDAANRARGGGIIRFDCRDASIRMDAGLGEMGNRVVIDGEDRNITLEYAGPFEGCSPSNNGIDGPPVGRFVGRDGAVIGLTFRNYLESLQIRGPGNRLERSTFLAHECSDDAVSTTDVKAIGSLIRGNRFVGYGDKAIQLNAGGGTIEGNEFVDCLQPIRGPYDNIKGAPYLIRDNRFVTGKDRRTCNGVAFDGRYVVHFEGNTLECLRGLRVGGSTEILIRDNDIRGNGRVGIRIGGSAVASISGNRILDNGREPGSLPAGGIVVWEEGTADLGGGELTIGGETIRSAGGNLIQGNGEGDVRNLREGYLLPARRNCWGSEEIPQGVDRGDDGRIVDGRCLAGKAPPEESSAARRAPPD